jgi:hypothetical protein
MRCWTTATAYPEGPACVPPPGAASAGAVAADAPLDDDGVLALAGAVAGSLALGCADSPEACVASPAGAPEDSPVAGAADASLVVDSAPLAGALAPLAVAAAPVVPSPDPVAPADPPAA